jgi:hypothetical protein
MLATFMNIGPMDVFRIFLMLTSLQQVLKQRLLEASRRKLIADIEPNVDHE